MGGHGCRSMGLGRRALRRRLCSGRRRDDPPGGRRGDRDLFDAVNEGHGPEADRVFVTVTELGSLYASGAAAGTLVALGRGRTAVRAFAATCATWLRPAGDEEDRRPAASPRRRSGRDAPADRPAERDVLAVVASGRADDLHPCRSAGPRVGLAGRGALSALDATVATSRVYLGRALPERRHQRSADRSRRRSPVAASQVLARAAARLAPDAHRHPPRQRRVAGSSTGSASVPPSRSLPTVCSSRSAS